MHVGERYMDAMEVILTRRSIRKYVDKPIDENILKKLINAGVSAPSAGNQQPWHFVVIDDKNIFDEILQFHPNAKMLKQCQKAILICGDLNLEKFKGYWLLDCSAATQNMLLAAHTMGLGSCWLGVYPRVERIKGIQKIFSMPENIIPFSLIALGYPDEKHGPVSRYEEARIHYNKW